MFKRAEDIRKASYGVMYMGWKACQGLYGRQFLTSISMELINDFLNEHSSNRMQSELTLQISKRDIKVYQDSQSDGQRQRCSTFSSTDVSYVCLAEKPHNDVVLIIILGSLTESKHPVHAHAYRCLTQETAKELMEHINQIVQQPGHRQRLQEIECDLVAKNLIRPSGLLAATTTRTDDSTAAGKVYARITTRNRTDEGCQASAEVGHKIDCLTAELKSKLTTPESDPREESLPPIPPPDYD